MPESAELSISVENTTLTGSVAGPWIEFSVSSTSHELNVSQSYLAHVESDSRLFVPQDLTF